MECNHSQHKATALDKSASSVRTGSIPFAVGGLCADIPAQTSDNAYRIIADRSL